MQAENAEQLMRSRYSAYVLLQVDYLAATWHADYRPASLAPDNAVKWLRLDVLNSADTGDRANVEFEARCLVNGRVEALHELSRFVYAGGRWLYTDGDPLKPSFVPWKPGRNEPCPCGSGVKFKRCCAC